MAEGLHDHAHRSASERAGAGPQSERADEVLPAPEVSASGPWLSAPPNLRPVTVRRLQRSAGNQAVARLIAPGGVVVQRRVPTLAVIDTLPNDAATLKKLKRTVLRTIKDQDPDVQRALTQQLGDLPTYVAAAGVPALKALISEIESQAALDFLAADVLAALQPNYVPKEKPIHPVQHPGGAASFVAWNVILTTNAHQAAMQRVVNQVRQQITAAASNDAAIKRVFDDDEFFGSNKWFSWAKDALSKAPDTLNTLYQNNMIGADLSGGSREMHFGGLTGPESMLLSKKWFDDLQAGRENDCLHTMCHEAFHTVTRGIKDEGGYRDEPEFPNREPAQKLANAEHFVEVVAQVNWGANPRKLRPPIGGAIGSAVRFFVGGDAPADEVGEAHMHATDTLRTAWAGALNGQEELIKLQLKQQALTPLTLEEQNTASYYARVFGLTLHTRVVVNQPYPAITDLDLALSEGVARRLSEAYSPGLDGLPKTNGAWTANHGALPKGERDVIVEAVRKQLVDLALQGVGPIRKSLARDRAMVETLFKIKKTTIDVKTAAAAALPK